MISIGQLAKQAGVRTSALRYYEEQGLLTPAGRNESGYRYYAPEALQILRFIQRAQRLGFSLNDIHTLLQGLQKGDLSNQALTETAEQRYLALERQVTERLVQQHELALFLTDLSLSTRSQSSSEVFDLLLERVCANPRNEHASSMLHWLGERTGCKLTSEQAMAILENLRGQHFHVWQEEDGYKILVVSQDPAVGEALNMLSSLEASCDVHPHQNPVLDHNEEGYLLEARGEEAFIFARIFLALEHFSS
ncbi:MAG TPA: MerR family transcriptional regulator [Anaerolineales bacterium]|nr:MerR family transcriptional regulator [Anaerolineales bacterium]